MELDSITIVDSYDGWVTVFINDDQVYQIEKDDFNFAHLQKAIIDNLSLFKIKLG